MAKEDRQKERVDNMSPGEHLGGTKFGQTPGTNDANPAKPDPKKADEKQEQAKK